jgi:hypothetical protein
MEFLRSKGEWATCHCGTRLVKESNNIYLSDCMVCVGVSFADLEKYYDDQQDKLDKQIAQETADNASARSTSKGKSGITPTLPSKIDYGDNQALKEMFNDHVFPQFTNDDQPFIDLEGKIGKFEDGSVVAKYYEAYCKIETGDKGADRIVKGAMNTEVRKSANVKDSTDMANKLAEIITGAWKKP